LGCNQLTQFKKQRNIGNGIGLFGWRPYTGNQFQYSTGEAIVVWEIQRKKISISKANQLLKIKIQMNKF
jgi:hypothetical protein